MRDNNAVQRPRSDFFSFLVWIFLHGKMETWVRVRKTSIEHAQMCLCFVWRFNTQTRFPKFSGTDKCAASVFKHRELLQHMEKEWNLSYTFKQQPSFKVPCLDLKLYSCDCCQYRSDDWKGHSNKYIVLEYRNHYCNNSTITWSERDSYTPENWLKNKETNKQTNRSDSFSWSKFTFNRYVPCLTQDSHYYFTT